MARRGFTLMELLLVLALVVAIGGLTYPALRGPLANHRLQGAAKQLRAELARLRLTAIESGEAQEFRYMPGEGRYRFGADQLLAPPAQLGQQDSETGPRLTAGGHSTKPKPVQSDAWRPRWEESSVSEGITFAAPDRTGLAALEQTPAEQIDVETMGETPGEPWSPEIVFRPDGTSTDATITLESDQDKQIVISLRGLTGLASLGELEWKDDDSSGWEAEGAP